MAKNAKQFEERPWGSFEILSEFEIDNLAFSEEQGYEVVIKKIVVKPGQRLSYQFHKKRKEKWICVQGRGIVIKNGMEHWFSNGNTMNFNPLDKHRIENKMEDMELIFVEVSTGKFDEKDIVRIEDDYKRKTKKK